MPESEIKIKATGGEEVKKTFKTIHDYAKELDSLSSKSSLSPKQMSAAKAAQDGFNKSIKETKKLMRELHNESYKYSELQKKALSLQKEEESYARKKGRGYLGAYWHEYGRQAKYFRKKIEQNDKKYLGLNQDINVGESSGKALGNMPVEDTAKNAAMGVLGKYLAPAAIVGLAYKIAKMSMAEAQPMENSLLDVAGMMRGSRSQVAGFTDKFVGGFFSPSGRFGIARQLGYNLQEAAGTASGLVHAGGSMDQGQIDRVLAYGRLGVDQGSLIGLKGTAIRGGGDLSGHGMQEIMSEAFASGLRKGRFNEFVESVNQLATSAEQTAASVKLSTFSTSLTALGMTGNPMLQGSRGGSIASAFQDSLLSPGAGTAGQMISLRAAGFGRGRSYLQARMSEEEGLTPENLMGALSLFRGMDKDSAILGLNSWSNGKISLHGAQALLSKDASGNTVEQNLRHMVHHPEGFNKYMSQFDPSKIASSFRGMGSAVDNAIERKEVVAAIDNEKSYLGGKLDTLIYVTTNRKWVDGQSQEDPQTKLYKELNKSKPKQNTNYPGWIGK